ncbi:MAG: hypothetical protein QF351_04920, partial [Phycisphaerales bacterium]|nr:hypothetical protein [Phycisphaerales bacterium]
RLAKEAADKEEADRLAKEAADKAEAERLAKEAADRAEAELELALEKLRVMESVIAQLREEIARLEKAVRRTDLVPEDCSGV